VPQNVCTDISWGITARRPQAAQFLSTDDFLHRLSFTRKEKQESRASNDRTMLKLIKSLNFQTRLQVEF
jgi:hypothetical protein